MIAVAMIGILVSTAYSGLEHYIKRSKSQEAVMNLRQMAEGQIQYHARNNEFIEVGPTNMPPSPTKQEVNFFSDDPNWARINFSVADPVYYAYQGVYSGEDFHCEAYGDLDGNGMTSTFRIALSIAENGVIQRSPLFYFDELE